MESIQGTNDQASALIERELDRETREVYAAIALVRSGVATVVTIANLRHCAEVVDRLWERAADDDVELEPAPGRGNAPGELAVRLLGSQGEVERPGRSG